jgi:hypothetical protein
MNQVQRERGEKEVERERGGERGEERGGGREMNRGGQLGSRGSVCIMGSPIR